LRNFELTGAAKANALGMVLAATGILTLFATGVADERFPVGAVILLTAAVLVVARIWKWMPVVGGFFGVFVTVGGFIAPPGFVYRLTHPDELSAFVGSTIQVVGLLITITAGVAALRENIRARSTSVV
jgi:hypothetical protein